MASPGAMEHAQNVIMERNLSFHLSRDLGEKRETDPLLGSEVGDEKKSSSFVYTYETGGKEPSKSIRFQVVIWYIGKIDVVQGRVPVTFRVTIFWNDWNDEPCSPAAEARSNRAIWKMQGRQTAIQQEVADSPLQTVDVPPMSILNAVTFDTIGSAEVALLRQDTKLWRWTCMYRATLFQDHWRVDNFPHDQHDICLKLAVLAHRKPGNKWDRSIWKLGLATANDSQGTTRIPYGLVVDQVSIPEFQYNKNEGLQFEMVPLDHGLGGGSASEQCLQVKLRVVRDSSYYDRNIVPLLGLLNLVAISITALEAHEFFQRSLLTLNIAFVEIGIRMTTDNHLPCVSYQIKMQRILNEYFYCLLFLVLESNLVYELNRVGWGNVTGYVDLLAALTVFSHNAWTLYRYYDDAARLRFMEPKSETMDLV